MDQQLEVCNDLHVGVSPGNAMLIILSAAQAYANSLVDYHLIMDLVPTLAFAFFVRTLPATLSAGQAAILLSLGLQQNDISVVERAMNLPASQLLALFNKVSIDVVCC